MTSVCLRHQDRPAVSRCKLCLKPVCEECKMETSDGVFCGEECRRKSESQKATVVQTDLQVQLDRQKQQGGIIKSLLSFIMLIAGLAVAGYIAWSYVLPPSLKIQVKLLIQSLLKK